MAKKIFIDPGHGGDDPGAVNGKRKESDDVLMLSLLVAEELKAQDIEVALARADDKNVPGINSRVSSANSWGADFYLSIHRNAAAASASGNEIWILSSLKGKSGQNEKQAKSILDAVCAVDKLPNRGVKFGAVSYTDYGVNSGTKMNSALLELGFISNSKDNEAFDRHYLDHAKAITRALCEAVGVEYKDTDSVSEPAPTPESQIPNPPQESGFAALDATRALRISARLGKPPTLREWLMYDIDRDGAVTALDARTILKVSARLVPIDGYFKREAL